jgi:hypothetical protein
MSENKFIERLKGEGTTKSVLEIKNESAKTSFANMPQGTSNAIDVFSDRRGNAVAVLEGTDIWKLNNAQFVSVPNAFGDGRDFTSTYTVAGSTLWVNATYSFDQPKIFTGATQWVLKLCGHSLMSSLSNVIGFSLIIKFGNTTTITKSFSVRESAFEFCKEFIIDFSESEQTTVKVANGDTMTVQLLCADATASATIYNGMTTLVAQQRRVDGDAVASDTKTFEELEAISDAHISNKNNPHEVTKAQVGLGNCDNTSDLDKPISTATQTALDGKVNDTGDTLTGMYKHEYGSRTRYMAANSTAKYADVFMNGDEFEILFHTSNSIYDGLYGRATNGYVTLYPGTDNQAWLGLGSRRWQSIFVTQLRPDSTNILTLPNETGVLALKSEVDLAANSGRMITDQGVWYAKMYAATVAPSAENGTNYADFSQTDGQGNPIIVIYNRVNGAWVQDQTITPPAEYDGYVSITSKIWDITEQTGQQGGRILWNHQSKEFTPYPQIISFENIAVTGSSTVAIPQNPTGDQIVNKNYVDNAIGDGTITITQDGSAVGSFTTNQSGNTTIDLASGGSGLNVGDTFLTMRNDNELNGAVECDGATYNTTDFTGAQSIGQLLADGKVPYVSMATYATEISTKGWCDKFGWDGTGNVQFKVPTLNAYIWQKLQLGIKGSIGTGSGGTYFVATQSSFTQYTHPEAGAYGVSVSNDQTIPGASVNITSEDISQQRCMVQLAVSASDEAVETCTGVLADIAALKYDYVVDFQAPTAQNNYTWYRKYRSGWVEQGGTDTSSTEDLSVTLPVTMANNNYQVQLTLGNTAKTVFANQYWSTFGWRTKTTTGFTCTVNVANAGTKDWFVCGMAA